MRARAGNQGSEAARTNADNSPMLERLKAPLRRFAVYRGLRFAWHLASDDVFRHDQLMRLRRPGNQFQYRSLTFPDRYPAVFSFLQRRLVDVPQPRVLSFGCATGDEVFTLRSYLPRAFIRGVDINAHDIAICRRRLEAAPDPLIAFATQDSAANEPPESYDAVLCLAVFQHQSLQDRRIETCEPYIRFAAFEATLAGLARCLKPGGYLAIRHADFRFDDAACRGNFACALAIGPAGEPHPRFDRHNRRLPDAHDREIVFRKQSAARGP